MTTPTVDILIVDDRPENLLALEAILEPLGQRVVRAASGHEALRKLLETDFAVILLDVQMPGMNGFEAARLIKSRERTKHIPIIFLTAISKDETFVFEGYSVGAVDYLSKPFHPDILRSKVAAFVDLYLKQRRITEQEVLLLESEKREMELRHVGELLQSEARYREVVTSAMDAIIIFDEHGTIRVFNAAAERMFGAPVTQAVGAKIDRFFPKEFTVETVDQVCRQVQGPRDAGAPTGRESTAQVAEWTALRDGGEEFPIEASVSCLDSVGGHSYTLIVRDVSERRRQEEALRTQTVSLAKTMSELRTANEELEQRQVELERAMTARSRFYASMSHELRTPINAVLGYSTLLLENIYGPLNQKQSEGIERTQKAARHLLELVNDVLDLSKIEAGKIDLRLQPVTFPSLIDDLFVTVRPLADQHGSALNREHDGPPAKVISDPRRVRQILLNLLSNAVKFGGGKPVHVTSRARPDGGAVIEVIDEGTGIAKEDQDRIFHEFVQLGKTQLQEGTGLGLPISRRLAELLRGSLEVESEVGKGSTFRLSLPASCDGRGPSEGRAPKAVAQDAPQPAADQGSKPGYVEAHAGGPAGAL